MLNGARGIEVHLVIVAGQRQAEASAGLAERGFGLTEAEFEILRFNLREQITLTNGAAEIHSDGLKTAGDLSAEGGVIEWREGTEHGDGAFHRAQFGARGLEILRRERRFGFGLWRGVGGTVRRTTCGEECGKRCQYSGAELISRIRSVHNFSPASAHNGHKPTHGTKLSFSFFERRNLHCQR